MKSEKLIPVKDVRPKYHSKHMWISYDHLCLPITLRVCKEVYDPEKS